MKEARGRNETLAPIAFAAFFVVVQFYTSLAALSPTPPVGYLFVSRLGAGALVAVLVFGALVALGELRGATGSNEPASRVQLGAWLGSATVAALLGLDPRSGLEVVLVMLLAALFALGLQRAYARPAVARALIVSYLVAGIGSSLAALLLLGLRRPAALFALNHGRAAGFFVTANQFASFLIVFVFVALGVALAASHPPLRRLAWAAVPCALVALALTFSRSGWIGAIAGAITFAALLRMRAVVTGLVAVAVLAGVIVALRPVARHDPADSFNRLATLAAGVRVVALFPLTGVGPMAYWRVYPSVRPPNGAPLGTFGALHPHDVYVSLAGETGALGIAAAVVGWLAFLSRLRALLGRASPAKRRLAYGVCAGLVAILAQGLFDTIGIVQMTFVWIPYTALALAVAEFGLPFEERPA